MEKLIFGEDRNRQTKTLVKKGNLTIYIELAIMAGNINSGGGVEKKEWEKTGKAIAPFGTNHKQKKSISQFNHFPFHNYRTANPK